MKKYIDVSVHQSKIDWETAKPHIDGAIIRAGYGAGTADTQFARNAAECNRLGIPCGAYWFSEAYTVEMAKAEARALLAAVKPYRMELPLCYDFEEYAVSKIKERTGITVTRQLATDMLYAFCETIEQGGYWALAYTNPNCIARYYSDAVFQRFGLWLAKWPGGTPDVTKPPRPDCKIWQWGGSIIPGITVKDAKGNIVPTDTDESYVDFADVIRRAGLNHLPKQYEDEDGSPIFEYTQAQTPIDPTKRAMEWAKNEGMIPDNAEASAPITWGDYALQMFREYGPEDKKDSRDSGLRSD